LKVWGGARARLLLENQCLEVFLEFHRELKSVVHVTGLLEATGSVKAIWFVRVGRTSDPSDTVVRVIRNASATFCGGKQLKTVIVDEDG
jgi:hypothetical protein